MAEAKMGRATAALATMLMALRNSRREQFGFIESNAPGTLE
jgi:hypothetical protein